LFNKFLLASGLDAGPEARKLALLRNNLGTERYPIFSELVQPSATYQETIKAIEKRFHQKATVIFSHHKFNRSYQYHSEKILDFVIDLRTLAAKCDYPEGMFDQLLRDRFVDATINREIREQLFRENDNLTLDQSLEIYQNFERAASNSKMVATCSSSLNVQSLTGQYN
jgi:hypothetical protein